MAAKDNLRIVLINYAGAKETCRRWHYTGSIGAPSTIRFGFWAGDRYDGLIAFNPNNTQPPKVTQFWERLSDGGKTVELSRIALRRQNQRESPTTRYVSLALSRLREMRLFDLLFTYSDPTYHEGTLYRACSFYQYETTKGPSVTYVRPDGSFAHSRWSQDRGADWKVIRMKRKERYFFPLTKRCRKRIERMIADGDKRILR